MPLLAMWINGLHIGAMTEQQKKRPEFIYHMAIQADWKVGIQTDVYHGSPDDLRDGFIHFSTAEQIRESAAKHRAGQTDLLLACFETKVFGDDLKWEGDPVSFPHVYSPIDPVDAMSIVLLPLGDDGLHVFPDGID
jgi:uncharacterized protein (DUF952 family)